MSKIKKQNSHIKGVAIDILREASLNSAEFDLGINILMNCNAYAFSKCVENSSLERLRP